MRDVRLTLHNLTSENKTDKFVHAVERLSSTLMVKAKLTIVGLKEELIPVLDSFVKIFMKEVTAMNEELYTAMELWVAGSMQKAEKVYKPKLPADVVYNPRTGKPMTQREWNKVTGSIDNYFAQRTKNFSQRIAQTGAAVGAITNRLRKVRGIEPYKVGWEDIKQKLPKTLKLTEVSKELKWKDASPVVFRSDNIATYVTDVNNKTETEIKRVLVDGMMNQRSNQEITKGLFETLHAKNKDWERIARTETQNAYEDGTYVTELSDATPGEKVYMIGTGSGAACAICQRDVIGKVVLLLPAPPAGGGDSIDDPIASIAIWPGKTSVGHSAREHWTCVTRHPHCGCRFIRYFPPAVQ